MNRLVFHKEKGSEYYLRNLALSIVVKSGNPEDTLRVKQSVRKECAHILSQAELDEFSAWTDTFLAIIKIVAELDN